MRRLLILACFALPACANGIGPSLAKRPVESRSMAEPARAAMPPAAADAALRSRIDALVAQAKAGQSAFGALLPQTQAAVAAAGAEGSEAWIAAQQSVSALENARAGATGALAELDRLIADRLAAQSDAGMVELQQADAEVAGLVDAQQRELNALLARVSR
ncbi:MAG TPA: hypothetical protein VE567_04640 [Sphingomonas sp.]|nr:hypothetical protein [Sphingomonas sp.]